MVRKRDRFWEYAEDLKGRFMCKFCDKEYSGGVARVKSHLSKQEGRDIAPCPRVSDDVQVSALSAIRVNENYNKRNKIRPSSSHVGEGGVDSSFDPHDSRSGLHEATVPRVCHKKDKEVVDKALAKTFFLNNISLNVIQDPSFIEFCKTLSNYGVGYSVPSCSTLRTKLVQDVKVEVNEYVSKIKESWTQTGCTLMFYYWTDSKGRNFINIIAYSPKGAIFLKKIEEGNLFDCDNYSSVIDEIGAKNVVQIITNDLEDCAFVNERVTKLYPHIYARYCVAQEIQSLLKDMCRNVDWVSSVFDNAKYIVDYMYKYDSVLILMKKMTGDKDLKKPCETRFAPNFLMLQSILEVEDELCQMVASPEWRSRKDFTSEMTQKITNIIQGVTFWSDGKEVVYVLEPLIRVLRLVDGEGLATGYLYEAMKRAREALKLRCDNDKARYMELCDLFDWSERNILHYVHAVAAYLNPSLMSSEKIRYDHSDVRDGLDFVMEKMLSSTDERKTFGIQITEYNTQSSDIFTSLARHQMDLIHPRVWWLQNGGPISIVQKIAIRILSQPCSLLVCRRNWRAIKATQLVQRNNLRLDTLGLLRIQMNLKKMANCGEREKRNTKIINLDQLGELHECKDDSEEEDENVEEASTSSKNIVDD